MSGPAAQKVRAMSQSDIPIAERRALYNGMSRRIKSGVGLKPGLVQKYNACISSKKERFAMLKEFIIDESMWGPQTFSTFTLMFVNLNLATPLKDLSIPFALRSAVEVEAYFVQQGSYHVLTNKCKVPLLQSRTNSIMLV